MADVDKWAGKILFRCMGGNRCDHRPGTCTADPEYQAYMAAKRKPDPKDAAEEIGRLVTRILALAPDAGLYVGIKIDPTPPEPDPMPTLSKGEM